MSRLEELIVKFCPDGVEYWPLENLGEFYNGLTGKNKDDFGNGNAKFISYMNVYSNFSTKLDVSDTVKVGKNEQQNQVLYGDVLFTGSSETPEECAMSSVVTVDVAEPIYLNSFCFGLRLFDKSIYLPNFLKHLLRGEEVRKQLCKTANGVTRFNVSKPKMAKVTIPRPPLPVQKEIVRILDNFTGLISELEAELAARRKQYEQYRDKLLTFGDDVDRLPLEKVSKKITDGMHNLPRDIEQHGDYPIISAENVSNGMVNILSRKYVSSAIFEKENTRTDVEQGDVLLTIVGAIGRTAVVKSEQRFLCQRSLCVIKPNIDFVTSHFIAYILESSQYQAYMNQRAKGAAQKGLYLAQVKKIEIPVPSLPEQERIVAILDKFDALCNDETAGLVAEIAARKKQYEYYRDRLLDFKRKESA